MYEHAFEEQEKQVKYTGLLTSCVILDNTVEISAALNTLAREGYLLTIDEVAALSPYQTRHIKRLVKQTFQSLKLSANQLLSTQRLHLCYTVVAFELS